MVAADGRLNVVNQAGDTLVFQAGPKYELLATNRLRERTQSSPAIAGGAIFIRTHRHLWCIGGGS